MEILKSDLSDLAGAREIFDQAGVCKDPLEVRITEPTYEWNIRGVNLRGAVEAQRQYELMTRRRFLQRLALSLTTSVLTAGVIALEGPKLAQSLHTQAQPENNAPKSVANSQYMSQFAPEIAKDISGANFIGRFFASLDGIQIDFFSVPGYLVAVGGLGYMVYSKWTHSHQ